MTEHVLVHNKAVHLYEKDQPQDTIELLVPGIYHAENDCHHLLYEEQPEEGGAVVTNDLMATAQELTISRQGSIHTRMTFRTGMLSLFVYETPHGIFQMGVRTHEYRMYEDNELLQFDLHYTLENDSRIVSECLMRITVTPGAQGP